MIYLDNAATTFPKPGAVYRALDICARRHGGNPGRGSHRLSAAAAVEIFSCREAVAELFHGSPENVVLTLNATYALNLAINALFRSGGEIVISGIEHNAVLRPVAASGAEYRIFDPSGGDDAAVSSFLSCLTPRTSLCVCNHVSKLCGLTLPVGRIGKICRERGIKFIIDASQSAGMRELDIGKCHADAVCAPGHKGLYGIQGSGFVLFSDDCGGAAENLKGFVYGGNGVNSLETFMPDFLPERFEAGTLPTPAAASLSAGIRWVTSRGIRAVGEYEEYLGERLKNGLLNISGVTVYGAGYRGGTVLFNIGGISSERVGEMLDAEGICVRCGYHCCPLGHRLLGTGKGGAVRASFSALNTVRDADSLLRAVKNIAAEKRIIIHP